MFLNHLSEAQHAFEYGFVETCTIMAVFWGITTYAFEEGDRFGDEGVELFGF